MPNERDAKGVGDPDPIGARIRHRRQMLGITLSELASRAGIKAPSFVHYIEKGLKVPSEEVARSLARALDDDEQLYVAWARLRQRGDITSAMEASRFLRHSLLGERAEPTNRQALLLQEMLFELARSSRPDMPWDSLIPKVMDVVATRVSVYEAATLEMAGPSHLIKIPLLAEGSDPGPWPGVAPEPLEVLRLDPRLVPAAAPLFGPFAYRITSTIASGGNELRPGDLAIFTRNAWPIQAGVFYALRHAGGIEVKAAPWVEMPRMIAHHLASRASGAPRDLVGRVAAVMRSEP